VLLTQTELLKILPHAYPFLMIDEVLDIKVGESLVAVKNLTANEWAFQNQCFQISHFPEPFLIEAAAQAALVLYALSDNSRGKGIKFLGKVKAEMHELPAIGERITVEVKVARLMKNLGFFNSSISCGDRKIMDLDLICGVMIDAK
jgi:3-hydroxyacyl-[acyl-carrier-protein] dehydratase